MRELGLMPCQPRPWRHSLTDSDPAARQIPDLVARDFTADAPGEKMIGDITYVPTWEGWVYLATVIDCHTRAVIGWAMDDSYKTHSSRTRSAWPHETVQSRRMRSSIPIVAAITRQHDSARH
ncbi:DDE-type integrase/transposase/recombinase [Amycolatopsis speibonae]|uniref:DDE-type integrase/transposase/recombinase n=1 Tax=Amycolatopsis speibonae TaxID=1450224 RepID=A0ABV7P2Y2_9PSEU